MLQSSKSSRTEVGPEETLWEKRYVFMVKMRVFPSTLTPKKKKKKNGHLWFFRKYFFFLLNLNLRKYDTMRVPRSIDIGVV